MAPPKALAPTKTGSRPMRPVRASGKESAAKAMKCTSLSLPSGAGSGASMGQSIATVRVSVTIMVRGMSRYLRIRWGVSGAADKGKHGLPWGYSRKSRKRLKIRGLGVPIRARARVGGLQILAFDFPTLVRYNNCYTTRQHSDET